MPTLLEGGKPRRVPRLVFADVLPGAGAPIRGFPPRLHVRCRPEQAGAWMLVSYDDTACIVCVLAGRGTVIPFILRTVSRCTPPTRAHLGDTTRALKQPKRTEREPSRFAARPHAKERGITFVRPTASWLLRTGTVRAPVVPAKCAAPTLHSRQLCHERFDNGAPAAYAAPSINAKGSQTKSFCGQRSVVTLQGCVLEAIDAG